MSAKAQPLLLVETLVELAIPLLIELWRLLAWKPWVQSKNQWSTIWKEPQIL